MGRGKQDLSKKPYKDRSERDRRVYEKRRMSNSKKKKNRTRNRNNAEVRDHAAEYEKRMIPNLFNYY